MDWLSVMKGKSNWYLLLYSVVLEFLTCCTVSGAIEDGLLSDLINKHVYPDVIQEVKYLHKVELENSDSCLFKFSQFWKDLINETQTAPYLDSFGKVGPGILSGNVVYLGYYDQCIDIGNTDFCRFPFDVRLKINATGLVVTIPFEFGMCFPSSCDPNDFYKLFLAIESDEVFYSNLYTDATEMTYTIDAMAPARNSEPRCPWKDLDWTTSSINVLTMCALLIALVIIGTIVDAFLWYINDVLTKSHRPEEKSPVTTTDSTFCDVKNSINDDEPVYNEDELFINGKSKLKVKKYHIVRLIEFLKDLILSFSLYKTVPVIMSSNKQPSNVIKSVNGMRVIAMLWLMLGYTFVLELRYNITANTIEVKETVPQRFLFQPIDNLFFAFDIFFVLSGLLTYYSSIAEMECHQGKFSFISFYIHRLLRISPAYFFVLFLNFKVLPYIGAGPFWFLSNVHRCEQYWWSNVLYINNFYPPAFLEQCYTISWYLAIEMQFFIISPIFILLLYHFWKIGLATILGTMLTSAAVIGTLAGIKNLNANLFQEELSGDGQLSFALSSINEKPYGRINSYLIGMVLGFILYKQWKLTCKRRWVRLSIYIALWMIAVTSCVTIVFGQYQTWHGHPFSKFENVMYFMFSHSVFSIGIALMIYACHNGYGGIINSILSWRFWIPLNRLMLMVYLCYPIVITLMLKTLRFRFVYTDWFQSMLVSSALVLLYSLALVLAIFVEYPLANVANAIYKFVGVKRLPL